MRITAQLVENAAQSVNAFLLFQFPVLAFRLQFHHAGIDSVLLQQFLRRAFFCHRAVCKHHNLIGAGHSAHPVGDHQYGLISDQTGKRCLDQRLIFNIQ